MPNRLPARFLLFGLAALVLSACSGGGSGSRSPTPAPTVPEPALADVPAGTTIDLARAADLYHQGDYDGALVIYSAAALNGTDAQKQDGLWGVARIQNEQGSHSSASRTVQAYRATNPPPDADRQALLLLGTSEFQRGDLEAARAALEEYLRRAGPAWPYAQLYLAQIDSQEIKLNSAIDRINQALQAGLPADDEYNAQLSLAGLLVQSNSTSDALAAYQAAADAAPTATKAAEALWLLADAADEAGDDAASIGALERIIAGYPVTRRALDAVDDQRVASDPAITPLERAIVYLNHGENEEAAAAFQAIVDEGGTHVTRAQYNLGILSERAADWQGAIDHYDAAISDPNATAKVRAQASWDKGTVLERIGLTSGAIDAYAAVSDFDPSAERAPEGLFRAGFLAYSLGAPADSLVYWQRYSEIAGSSENIARADYWLSTASAALGDADSAAVYLQAAAEDDPLDYYGMRAAARLAGDTPPAASTLDGAAPPDWARYETWLAGWAGPEDVAGNAALFTGEPWLRGVELYEAGLTSRADAQWRGLLNANASEPWLVYRLVRAISEYHRPWVTSPAAAGLLGEPGAPPEALQLVYPLEYASLVDKEAAANDLPPFLLLGLVRQESLYDPSAVSIAEAMGLTQVVPSTAEGIAQELGITDFKASDLLQAKVALQFGAYYLGSTLAGFGGEPWPAVAGYNAGPGAAANWRDIAGADPDLFLETVDFSETRLFVEVVLENYARYLYGYGVTDHPTLPLS